MENSGRIDIKSLSPNELRELTDSLGQPGFRAKQIHSWIARGVMSANEMTDLPSALRHELSEICSFSSFTPVKRFDSSDGTVKFLRELTDGETIETAIMRYDYGNTICVSTQVGCGMGCAFCASTIGGKVRNLTAGEMHDQVVFSEKEMNMKINNIVLMGIGEPLDNYDNVVRFIRNSGIGARHITLSTCGLTESIDKLALEGLQLTLSVSLHAPDDETRSKIMPVNKKYGIEALMRSVNGYREKTGRRVTFEYALIGGVNDTPAHARMLIRLLQGRDHHVNLILLNPVPERNLQASTGRDRDIFCKILTDGHIQNTVRRRLGRDIEAACGQLRRYNKTQ